MSSFELIFSHFLKHFHSEAFCAYSVTLLQGIPPSPQPLFRMLPTYVMCFAVQRGTKSTTEDKHRICPLAAATKIWPTRSSNLNERGAKRGTILAIFQNKEGVLDSVLGSSALLNMLLFLRRFLMSMPPNKQSANEHSPQYSHENEESARDRNVLEIRCSEENVKQEKQEKYIQPPTK